MNNCEKKLDALIDALGFDVEAELNQQKYNSEMYMRGAGPDYELAVRRSCQGFKLTKRDTKSNSFDCLLTERVVLGIINLSKSAEPFKFIRCRKGSSDIAIKWFGLAAKKQSEDHYYIYDVSVELIDEKI